MMTNWILWMVLFSANGDIATTTIQWWPTEAQCQQAKAEMLEITVERKDSLRTSTPPFARCLRQVSPEGE